MEGTFNKGKRRHHVAGMTVVQGNRQSFYKPVVVEVRHPGDGDAVGVVAAGFFQIAAVEQYIIVTNCYAFGRRGRTRCVLKISQRIARDFWIFPCFCQFQIHLFGVDPAHRAKFRDFFAEFV